MVVEHPLGVVAQLDQVIDIGPGAGSDGVRLLFSGEPRELLGCEGSLTGRALAVAGEPRS